jgi:hypothetical protein
MGKTFKGVCKKCGYNTKDLYLGGGFFNRSNCCNYPVLKIDNTEIITENYNKKEEIEKDGYVFYDRDDMSEAGEIRGDIFNFWEVKLKAANYYCPKCKEYGVKFHFVGMWD